MPTRILWRTVIIMTRGKITLGRSVLISESVLLVQEILIVIQELLHQFMAIKMHQDPVTSGLLISNLGKTESDSTTTLSTVNSRETHKTALTCNAPISELLFHGFALTVISVFVYFNATNLFWQELSEQDPATQALIKPNQGSELKAMQVAAKIHEVFVQSSLSAMVLFYVHRLLIDPKGVPFGLLDCQLNNSSPSMLRRWRFWYLGFGINWRLVPLALLLFITCIFSFIIGPSSAIIMIPSLNWWPYSNPFSGKTLPLYMSQNSADMWRSSFKVFNSSVDSTFANAESCEQNPNNPQIGCPLQGFQELANWMDSLRSGVISNLIVTELYTNTRRTIYTAVQNQTYDSMTDDRPPASCFTTSLAERMVFSIGSLWQYIQAYDIGSVSKMSRPRLTTSPTINTYQPLVHVVCQSYSRQTTNSTIQFPILVNAWNSANYIDEPFTIDTNLDFFDDLPTPNTRFSWFKDPRQSSSTSLLAAAIIPIFASNSTGMPIQESEIVLCSIDARWAADVVSYQPLDSTDILTNLTNPGTFAANSTQSPADVRSTYGISEYPIDLDLSWAHFLNFNWTGNWAIGVTNVTFSTMAMLLFIACEKVNALDDTEIWSFEGSNSTASDLNSRLVENTVASLISTVVTDAVSRTGYYSPYPLLGIDQNGTSNTLLTFGMYPGAIASSYLDNLNTTSLAALGDFVLKYDVQRYGYAYGLKDSTSKAALACWLFYSTLVILHLLYIGWLGFRGRYRRTTAWGDICELLVLAKNSTPIDDLHGTSAGIEKISTWELKVRVKEIDEGHLALVFGDDEGIHGRQIEAGKKYL